ncbi:efflux RND transporter periplasmic adaptor subunit [Anaerosalibacter massiliensis]|uniref:Efflux RND transporter periplasmic adaptor subunit n=1 Tax=Anaerosalibacter massiliensis TaxID=1347392 RepID=A0A9X2MIG3_9FIRM|nr:efflux RND transporter periplasmic adaptor subunit [Anaerosalibacter massiliensis]MCR2044645.1 efflux RND transporter periplasmic adaptor subunit [Anaerosalibacter massiliensis]
MSKRKKIALLIIGIAILTLVFTLLYFGRKNKNKKPEEKAIERYVVPSRENVFVNGSISPRTEQTILPDPTKGKVEKTHVKDGAEVKKGDPLITYKNEEVSEQISEFTNELNELKEAKKEENKAINNRSNIEINEEGEEGEGLGPVAPSADYDSQIKKLERQISNLKKKEYTVEHSKLDGKVSLEKVNIEGGGEGEKIVVQSHDFVANGSITEVDLLKLKEGMNVEITLISDESKKTGKIESISKKPSTAALDGESMGGAFGGSDESSFSEYPIKFSLDDQKGLVHGFHVQVKIPYGESKILIPETAVIKENGKTYVFLIEEGILKKHEIQTGKKEEEHIIVTKGLKENDELVAEVTEDLKEGDEVE